MCKVLNVSESGYYRWLKNRDKATRRQLLSAAIKDILNEHPDNSNYGVNRIQIALMQAGIEVSRRTIYRAMKEAYPGAGKKYCPPICIYLLQSTEDIYAQSNGTATGEIP